MSADDFWRRFEVFYGRTAEQAIKSGLTHRLVNVELKKGDVVIQGWPKTGTTLLQQLLHQLRTGGDESFKDIYSTTKYIPFHFEVLPTFDPNFPEQPSKPRVFKNHDEYDWRPKGDGVKYICVTREKFDTIWSLAKFVTGFIGGQNAPELDGEGMERFMASPVFQAGGAGTLDDWLVSWFPHRNDPNVLWVHYEDMIENMPHCVRKIAEFVEVPLTPELEKLVVERCSFDYMLKRKDQFQGDEGILQAMKDAIQENWVPSAGMVRPGGGKPGQGKKGIASSPKLTKEFQEEWDAKIKAKFGFANYAEMRKESSLLKK
jgi:hypothetical protein